MARPKHAWILALSLVCGWPNGASAQRSHSQELPELKWKDGWHRANLWDLALVAGGFGLYLAEGLVPRRDSPAWQGPILWDSALRDLLRSNVRGNRDTASTISDVMLTGSLIQNLLFDNMVVALGLHQEPDVAWQMTVSAAEAYAISFALTSWIKSAAGRQRPFQDRCAADPEYNEGCGNPTAYRSFVSGHSSATAVGAGLLCAHHLNMPLYDGEVLDIGVCAVGVALTLATGAMRLASDKHWATDVSAGHLVGFTSGYLVPTLLYYTGDKAGEASNTAVLPAVGPDRLGVQVLGRM